MALCISEVCKTEQSTGCWPLLGFLSLTKSKARASVPGRHLGCVKAVRLPKGGLCFTFPSWLACTPHLTCWWKYYKLLLLWRYLPICMHAYVCMDTASIPSAIGTQFMNLRTGLTKVDAEEKICS